MQIENYLWSDNWWLEENKAYICAANYAELFCVDMITLQCKSLVRLPECDVKKYRLNSYCRKYKNKIFCFPYEEKKICCYDVEKKTIKQINVDYAGSIIISMQNYKATCVYVWLAEYMGKKMCQINLEKGNVEKEYIIPSEGTFFTGHYILVKNKLYCVSGRGIYCIDIGSGDSMMLEISNIKTELYTICYDGCNFWLSGNDEVIYVWSAKTGIVKEIKNFLQQTTRIFQESNMFINNLPLFSASVSLGKYVWYIPLQCNAPIIYIDKENYQVAVLEVENEQENEESLQNRENAFKYMFEYIREDRYIGLYSYKNQVFFEIDTVEMCVMRKELVIDEGVIFNIAQEIYSEKGIIYEGSSDGKELFSILLNNIKQKRKKNSCIGQLIYHCI